MWLERRWRWRRLWRQREEGEAQGKGLIPFQLGRKDEDAAGVAVEKVMAMARGRRDTTEGVEFAVDELRWCVHGRTVSSLWF
ncbi:hypothetical protein E2542_SST26017 [Spatholobus suberectus]|nr:hypothetical protein E2542_SST26017 [Spatholobus suberectus]